MTLKEILVFLHNRALLCDEQYENDEAIRLCNRIESELHKTDDINFISCFYLNFCKICLSGGRVKEADALLRKFDFFFSGKRMPIEIIDFRYYLMGKILFLKGDFVSCGNYIDQVVNRVSETTIRYKLYALKGFIETENNKGPSTFKNLSIALGEAEKSKDKKSIANCYLELARALNRSYNALAASLIREAERIAKDIKDEELYYSSLIQRSNIYIFMGLKYNKNEFITEAKNLINGINEDNLKFIGLKELYWSVKGWMLGDTKLLERSLQFNANAGSWGRVCSVLIPLFHISIEQGDKLKAIKYARQGVDAAFRCKNKEVYDFFKEQLYS
jgi:hypothetical protein